jgi:hypothetical protein
MMTGTSRVSWATLAAIETFGRRIDVETDHAPASLDEIAGNRAAHDAETNDSNRLVHACLFPTLVFY